DGGIDRRGRRRRGTGAVVVAWTDEEAAELGVPLAAVAVVACELGARLGRAATRARGEASDRERVRDGRRERAPHEEWRGSTAVQDHGLVAGDGLHRLVPGPGRDDARGNGRDELEHRTAEQAAAGGEQATAAEERRERAR